MNRLGFHGKLPAVGDFVSRGFTQPLCDALDAWLQAALQAAQSGGATRASLDSTAVPVLLHVRPGVLCSSGFVGAVVPSSDRVGRFFPICLGLEMPPEAAALPLLWPPLPMALSLCRLGIEAQAEALGPDALAARLADLPAPADWPRWMITQAPFQSVQDITLPGLPEGQARFAFQGPEARMGDADRGLCSLLPMRAQVLGALITQAEGFDAFFGCRQVADGGAFAALFDGRWAHWGWPWVALTEPDDDTVPATLPDTLPLPLKG